MSSSYRAFFVGDRSESHALLVRMLEGSDISVDDVVSHDEVIASVARRTPDLIVVSIDVDARSVAGICRVLKANPATVAVPLLALARTVRSRLAAFDAGVDDFLTHQIRRDEFLVRVHGLLRAAASRRQLAAEQLADEVKRREVIRAAFRRYISPKVADHILDNPELRDLVLTGTNARTPAAVMFADMRGFTALSERLAPGEVVGLLNEFFGLLTDVTFEYDGTIFNMAGDSLLVGFGVPVEQADGPQRAMLAARQMLVRFGQLADRWQTTHEIETGLGIGINVGEVIAGNVGSASYMNYTIIGDTVNVAARLAQRARAGELLFSQAVMTSLDGAGMDVEALALPPMVLRGRSNPIDIFCVPSGRRIDFRPH
ncbi:adenylate/guanylate cyclase domain-containing protein [Povalibacter sp.]|uniref:adenylate/guanylate cyclase domain-containing protein n=1 Tax=Povalibacter sp. TaxID=1962978 RepID=UPI002F425FF8